MRLRAVAALTAVVLVLLVATSGRISSADAEDAANTAGRVATQFLLGVATAAGTWITTTVIAPMSQSVTDPVLPSPRPASTRTPRAPGGAPTVVTDRS